MTCSDVGSEIWFFWALTTAGVVAFLLRARDTQRWLRDHRRTRNVFLGVGWLLKEQYLWLFRSACGGLLLLMWVVVWVGVYCYFHGPDVPSPGR